MARVRLPGRQQLIVGQDTTCPLSGREPGRMCGRAVFGWYPITTDYRPLPVVL